MIQASKAKQACLAGAYDALFEEIYQDTAAVCEQRVRYAEAMDQYIRRYGDTKIEIYSAPGRTEIGGNHTDHQHGCVLAAAVNLDIIGIVGKAEGRIRINSDGKQLAPVEIEALEKKSDEQGTSEALVRGVCAYLKQQGYQIGGFDAFFTSDVLVGSGLSSSAAFEVMIAVVLAGLYNDAAIDPVTLAKAGQFAENVYFGKPCGLMDQCASAVGGMTYIDFQRIQQPEVEKLGVDFSSFGYSLCIVDTRGTHADLTEEYAAITEEMREVARMFGKEYLREVSEEAFIGRIAEVRQACGDRAVLRALHFFGENKRAGEQAVLLSKGDFAAFLQKVQDSGNSSYKFLQNVYANKTPQSQSVSLALALSEKFLQKGGVCRVHGGGFAGTIQAFVPDENVAQYKQAMERVFGKDACHILKIRPDGGKRIV